MLINTLKTFLTLTFLVTFGDTLTLSLKSLSGQFPFIQHYRDNVNQKLYGLICLNVNIQASSG